VELLATLKAAIGDRYEVERQLGQGAMAEVFAARDLALNRRVAIKVLRPDVARAVGAERFVREVEIAARLQHTNILPLHEHQVVQGLFYYVMPLVEGETLRDRLRREVQLPIADALQIAAQVARGLDHAHSYGVVHRDIKPENILLSGDQAYVADFGIACLVEAAGEQWRGTAGTGMWRTETGIVVGTLGYMSPEQATAAPRLDGRSDQYSLACVVYEMLAGETPFQGATLQVMVSKLLTLPPPSVRVTRESVSGVLDVALQRALSRTPADRFRTCGEFVAALGRRPGWWDRAVDLAGTRTARRALAAAGLSTAVMVIGIVASAGPNDGELAVDSARYVIFPFQREAAAGSELTEARLHDAFGPDSAWFRSSTSAKHCAATPCRGRSLRPRRWPGALGPGGMSGSFCRPSEIRCGSRQRFTVLRLEGRRSPSTAFGCPQPRRERTPSSPRSPTRS
jgi:serine/threonine-protein kinase